MEAVETGEAPTLAGAVKRIRQGGRDPVGGGFLELGVSKTAIAKHTGVSRTTLYSVMNTHGRRPGGITPRHDAGA